VFVPFRDGVGYGHSTSGFAGAISFVAFSDTDFKLAELSKKAHIKTREYLEIIPPQSDLTAMQLGRLRLDINRYLTDEMREIDKLVEAIIK
jgi:hypothetical protein